MTPGEPPIHPSCPTCGKVLDGSNDPRDRPFCSTRCRLLDLWGWFSERHRIPVEQEPASPDDGARAPDGPENPWSDRPD
jgi:hypothetical protein